VRGIGKMLGIALRIMEHVFSLSKRCKVFQIFRFVLAPVFIRVFGEEYLKRHVEIYEKFVKDSIFNFCSISEDFVLDVGCGAGVLSHGVGIDIVRYQQWKGGRFVVGDAHNLPFKDKTFDTVLLSNLLEHVENPEKVLKEAKRVSREKIYVSFPTKYSLSALYHILSGEKAKFYGGLDYDFVKKVLHPEFAVVRERERILPFKLPSILKNFSNPEMLFKRVDTK